MNANELIEKIATAIAKEQGLIVLFPTAVGIELRTNMTDEAALVMLRIMQKSLQETMASAPHSDN